MIELKRGIVYTREEADKMGLVYKDWRECGVGEWGITKDGYVSACISRGKNYDKHGGISQELAYPWGKAWYRVNAGGVKLTKDVNAMEYIEKRAFNRTAPITYGQECLNRRKVLEMIKAFILMLSAGEVDYMKLGMKYMPNNLRPDLNVKRVLKQKEVIKYVEEEMIKRMMNIGIDKPREFALRLLQKAAKFAEAQENPDSLVKVAKELNLLMDAYPKKSTQTDQLEFVNRKVLEDNIEKEETKLLASRTTTE